MTDAAGLVRLHVFELDRGADDAALLDAAEQARAARFRFDVHRDRFIAGRAALRRRLAAARQEPPARVPVTLGPFGKPFVPGGPHFNLSHSGQLAALAVAVFPVGVDIEAVRPVDPALAARFFAPDEVAALAALPKSAWLEGFYRVWTRKEAFVKATGEGLTRSLDGFAVSVGVHARLLRVDERADEATCWTMHDFALAPDVMGAVTARETALQVVLHDERIFAQAESAA